MERIARSVAERIFAGITPQMGMVEVNLNGHLRYIQISEDEKTISIFSGTKGLIAEFRLGEF